MCDTLPHARLEINDGIMCDTLPHARLEINDGIMCDTLPHARLEINDGIMCDTLPHARLEINAGIMCDTLPHARLEINDGIMCDTLPHARLDFLLLWVSHFPILSDNGESVKLHRRVNVSFQCGDRLQSIRLWPILPAEVLAEFALKSRILWNEQIFAKRADFSRSFSRICQTLRDAIQVLPEVFLLDWKMKSFRLFPLSSGSNINITLRIHTYWYRKDVFLAFFKPLP